MRFGRYELLHRIGAGGMADVFLAERRGPRGVSKRLALKRIMPEHANDPRFVELLEREAKIGCALSHGNLVTVFELGRVDDQWFIAMEHVDGRDLAAIRHGAIARGIALPDPVVARIAIEVCRGLAHLHARGYVHRDVTPRNVLVSWDGQVKLSDFGIALAAAELAGTVRGTPRYMAPEQTSGGRLDARTDVYSLGAILRELGSPALVPLAARACDPDPAQRFATADALRAALEPIARNADERAVADALAIVCDRPELPARAIDHEATTAPTALAPITPVPRRSRLWIALASAVAIAVAVLVHASSAAPNDRPLPASCSYGDGYYCSGALRAMNPTLLDQLEDDGLYVCAEHRAVLKEHCEFGCIIKPPGQPDICAWHARH